MRNYNLSSPKINTDIYEIIENRPIDDLKSQGLLLKHRKTGARLTLLLNDDDNKVFYIAFRTPPTDSTGVAHILEHCVLCGSEKFPVKDPFIELVKGSLNTFLNAMTYPDKTVYPVASLNDKDFANLMHVYLDAVFFPNIYKEEKIFMQEGWHYETAEEGGELIINGVVYNEMKGAFSTPDDVMEKEITASLFPEGTYGFESGGDPDCIPDLTYEQFIDFHRRYYHPSNSFIYLYGNMDIEERLEFLDKEYLSRFERLEIDSTIHLQKSFTEPLYTKKEYPVMEGDDINESTYLTYNTSLNTGVNERLYIAFQVLDYALCASQGAVLKQALLDKRLGKDILSIMEMGIGQPFYSIIAKDSNSEREAEFIATIRSVLTDVVNKGLDKKALYAGLNHYEFRYREADFGSYPKGLIMGLQALDSWLYDERKPFLYLEALDTFKSLKADIETDYFENLIQKYLLDNPHKSIMQVVPVEGLTAQNDEKLEKELKAYKDTLSEDEITAIKTNAEELTAYQEEPSKPEDLLKIPMLKREDVRKESIGYVNDFRKAGETTVLFHDIPTNGIGYLSFMFDITKIPAELYPYLGILKSTLALVDTENFAFADLFNEINIYTGGLRPTINTYADVNDLPNYRATMEIKVKALYENIVKAFSLISEIIMKSRYDNDKRLYEIIAELKSKMETTMSSSGHSLAALRALSYFSETAAVADAMSGIIQYRMLVDLEENFSARKSELSHKLALLSSYLFRAENLMVDYTATEEGYIDIEAEVKKFAENLYKNPIETGKYHFEAKKLNEGFMTAGQVQYVCRAGNFITKGLPYHGALKVLKVMMGYEYLWTQIRVLGGAYGCMCNFTKTGDSFFVSYRDPHLTRTIETFAGAAAFVRDYQADERAVTQFVLGAIGDLDTPMTPAAKGSYSLTGYMSGVSFEMIQKERDELLNTDLEMLKSLYKYIEAFIDYDCLCVVGAEEKIKENKDIFMTVSPLIAK
ncbi:MAG: insulinase family protein [Lachnospiraceae bacterium]|nr:insulinase family protein [Lachnospiraceae bacterium]